MNCFQPLFDKCPDARVHITKSDWTNCFKPLFDKFPEAHVVVTARDGNIDILISNHGPEGPFWKRLVARMDVEQGIIDAGLARIVERCEEDVRRSSGRRAAS